MLQLDNQTPFAASLAVLPDKAGIDTLYVVIKATVNLRPKLSLAAMQVPVSLVDEYYEDPANSSLKLHSDMHIGKAGTDVLMMGHARAPKGQPAEGVIVSLSIAERSKRVLVMGDRTWRSDGSPSPPQPFSAIPLVWERAFGGMHVRDDRVFAEERNPVGCGFRGKCGPDEMVDQPVPNLEDPVAPIGSWDDSPTPACFAAIAPSWLPRRAFAGTYDAAWQRARAPYLPPDFDHRFFQLASSDLCFERYLQGGEQAHIEGVDEESALEFTVPMARPTVEVSIAKTIKEAEPKLETLLFEPDENRASMTWRASMPCDRQALRVEKAVIKMRRSTRVYA
ncbi:MAG TPA: DUF2169 domain-containing protein [Steroidobacteraceae bacterium]|jgi:hypothetical protein|nr:DUF2169 domain-containing protein [Steroidobacteraceae bacterium]